MTKSFDPYRKWLGIPEQERPPNHYRLLGIELFESDADVISNAADGRMAQLKNYQAGKYSAYSQKLLNEIAAAKVCLLHPARKEDYDRDLQQRDGGRGAKDGGECRDEEIMEIAGIASFGPARTSSYAHRAGRKSSRWQMPLIMTGGAVLFIIFLAFWTDEDAKDITPKQALLVPSVQQVETARSESVSAKPTKQSSDEKPNLLSKPMSDPEEHKAPAETPKPATLKPNPLDQPVDEGPDKLATAEEKIVPAESVASEPKQVEPKKLPVPDAAQQRAAERKILDVFGEEYTSAKKTEQKLGLAAKFLEQAQGTNDDPAVRFVLLRLACEMTAVSGGLADAFGIVEKIQQDYDIRSLPTKIDLLAKAVEANQSGGRGVAHVRATVDTALCLMDEAAKVDDYEAATRIGKLCAMAGRNTKDSQFIHAIAVRNQKIDRMKAKFISIKKAMEKLEDDPADLAANLTVGQWYCFLKGNWLKGLPLLAKGDDEKLAKQAERDLSSSADAKAQAATADAWWELAESKSELVKAAIRTRAVHWYEQALPGLTGLEKMKAQKRIEAATVETVQPVPTVKGRGAVEPGNVALASNGTTVAGVYRRAELLLDGNSTRYDSNNGSAWSNWPCEWTITFQKTYRLQAICLLLHDTDKQRFYRYRIQISSDGKSFIDLVDRSQAEAKSWQRFTFSSRPVRAVKLVGLYNSANSLFPVVELEAYCVLPPSSQHWERCTTSSRARE